MNFFKIRWPFIAVFLLIFLSFMSSHAFFFSSLPELTHEPRSDANINGTGTTLIIHDNYNLIIQPDYHLLYSKVTNNMVNEYQSLKQIIKSEDLSSKLQIVTKSRVEGIGDQIWGNGTVLYRGKIGESGKEYILVATNSHIAPVADKKSVEINLTSELAGEKGAPLNGEILFDNPGEDLSIIAIPVSGINMNNSENEWLNKLKPANLWNAFIDKKLGTYETSSELSETMTKDDRVPGTSERVIKTDMNCYMNGRLIDINKTYSIPNEQRVVMTDSGGPPLVRFVYRLESPAHPGYSGCSIYWKDTNMLIGMITQYNPLGKALVIPVDAIRASFCESIYRLTQKGTHERNKITYSASDDISSLNISGCKFKNTLLEVASLDNYYSVNKQTNTPEVSACVNWSNNNLIHPSMELIVHISKIEKWLRLKEAPTYTRTVTGGGQGSGDVGGGQGSGNVGVTLESSNEMKINPSETIIDEGNENLGNSLSQTKILGAGFGNSTYPLRGMIKYLHTRMIQHDTIELDKILVPLNPQEKFASFIRNFSQKLKEKLITEPMGVLLSPVSQEMFLSDRYKNYSSYDIIPKDKLSPLTLDNIKYDGKNSVVWVMANANGNSVKWEFIYNKKTDELDLVVDGVNYRSTYVGGDAYSFINKERDKTITIMFANEFKDSGEAITIYKSSYNKEKKSVELRSDVIKINYERE